MSVNAEEQLLPHHEQKDFCTTRLPYRQGRKLTAVKVYTINNESKHLLIFGVPSLNLRQETKALFMKFGKVTQFNLTKHPSEQFTETYHALYESIQSARIAKKMLDTKNYYGGCLHICYAPELESIEETREKLLLRKTHVTNRLRNLQREAEISKKILHEKVAERLVTDENEDSQIGNNVEKIYMGSTNNIILGKHKQKIMKTKTKKIKIDKNSSTDSGNTESRITDIAGSSNIDGLGEVEIVDFTSPNMTVVSNINEAL